MLHGQLDSADTLLKNALKVFGKFFTSKIKEKLAPCDRQNNRPSRKRLWLVEKDRTLGRTVLNEARCAAGRNDYKAGSLA